jgi:hypothetical protein
MVGGVQLEFGGNFTGEQSGFLNAKTRRARKSSHFCFLLLPYSSFSVTPQQSLPAAQEQAGTGSQQRGGCGFGDVVGVRLLHVGEG